MQTAEPLRNFLSPRTCHRLEPLLSYPYYTSKQGQSWMFSPLDLIQNIWHMKAWSMITLIMSVVATTIAGTLPLLYADTMRMSPGTL